AADAPVQVAVQARVRHAREQPGEQSLAQPGDALRHAAHQRLVRVPRRDAQPHDRGHVLGARAPAALVLAAVHLRLEAGAPAHEQRRRPLRAVELVRGHAQQVRLPAVHRDRDLARRLHGVDVEQRAALLDQRAQLVERLDDAGLVVTAITLTSATSGASMAASSSGSTTPFARTGMSVSAKPSASSARAVASTEACSIAVVTSRLRPEAARSAPRSARLLDSLPVAVNTISSDCPPTRRATSRRAASIASRAASPRECTLEALPKRSASHGCIAATTSAAGRVVAAL